MKNGVEMCVFKLLINLFKYFYPIKIFSFSPELLLIYCLFLNKSF